MTSRSTPSHRARGFTLVELLVALVLLALVSVALVAGVRSTIRVSEAATHRAEASQELRLVSELIRRNLTATVPVQTLERGQAKRIPHFEGESDRIRFVVETPARFRVGGLYETTIEQGRADGQPVVRWSRQLLHPDLIRSRGVGIVSGEPSADATGDERVLVTGAELELSYFGAPPRLGEARWHERWDGEWGTPDLVRVAIRSEDEGAWPPIVARLWVSRPRFRSVGATGEATNGTGEDETECGPDDPECER